MPHTSTYTRPGRQLMLFPEVLPAIVYLKGPNYEEHKKEIRRLVRKNALLPVNKVQFTKWINGKLLRKGKPVRSTDTNEQGTPNTVK